MVKTPSLTLDANLPNHSRLTAAEIEVEIFLACLERKGSLRTPCNLSIFNGKNTFPDPRGKSAKSPTPYCSRNRFRNLIGLPRVRGSFWAPCSLSIFNGENSLADPRRKSANHSRLTAAEIEADILLACLEREGAFEPPAVFPYSMVKTPYLTLDANLQFTQALPQQR